MILVTPSQVRAEQTNPDPDALGANPATKANPALTEPKRARSEPPRVQQGSSCVCAPRSPAQLQLKNSSPVLAPRDAVLSPPRALNHALTALLGQVTLTSADAVVAAAPLPLADGLGIQTGWVI